jgi:hypothetical protein
MTDDGLGQESTVDAEQLAFADRKTKQRRDRRRELWRWLLSQSIGRELLYDVVLGELGYLRHIGGPLEDVYSQAALHNLCCRLMATDILPHRELFLQMQNEAMKREALERAELEAARVKWATRETSTS